MERKPLLEQDILHGRMQVKHTPYVVIIVFCIFTTFARMYMVQDWPVYFHIGLFFTQAIALSCIWRFVMDLNDRLERYFPFRESVAKRMLVQIGLTYLVLVPVIGAVFYFMHPHFPPFVTRQFIVITIMLFVILVVLFNFAFYAFYFFGNWQRSVQDKARLEVQAAELEKEKFNLQYHQLRNQVNPHYLFNTLTSLDGLIHTDPELASEFVRHMAKVYRYVLQHNERIVVHLEQELDFIQHYMQLLHIRYGTGLVIQQHISSQASDMDIVMVTLQMLIDNAIKHNVIQPDKPFQVDITDDDGYLVVANNKQLRRQIETSNGQGLQQLKQLYSYLTAKPVIVEETGDRFIIKIPLL